MAAAETCRRLAAWLCAAGLCAGGYWSARLAWAGWLDREGFPESVRRAAELAPERADLRARQGDWAGAVSRNRFDAASWIRLGLDAEQRGDWRAAERSLLRAAEVDRLYEPRWALANYCFRRRDRERFWLWARAAAERSPETPIALFRLCRETTADWGEVFDRVAGGQERLLAGFLFWALPRADGPGLQRIARSAAETGEARDRDALNALLRRLLELGCSADALAAWNRLVERRVLDFEALRPEQGVSLTNGDFRRSPKGEAFNWALPENPGVTSRALDAGLRFEFSGRQPESCDLLVQTVPVSGGRRYRLRWRYRTGGIPPGAGPLWLPGGSPLSSDGGSDAALEFATRPGEELVRLRLAYQRIPGTTRISGTLWLDSVRLELIR
ncbi:MAG: hypothetical protein HY822_07645 [Acidobacteria bacterium]|nr:hypothetical protein [Acidobacteriota bacterium]